MKYEPYAPTSHGDAVEVRIRDATPDDADAIAAIDGERNGIDPASIVERVRANLAAGRDGHVLVAEVGGAVAGFGRLGRIEAPTAPHGWYLVGIVVRRDLRRHGIGRALVAARLRKAAELGAAEVFYAANRANLPSIELHRAFGFELFTDEFELPRAAFAPGEGRLFRARVETG